MRTTVNFPLVGAVNPFIHLLPDELVFSGQEQQTAKSFLDCCTDERMPLDHYGNGDTGADGAVVRRFRRYTTCRFWPGHRCLLPLDGPDAHRFYQSPGVNQFQGGNFREWQGIEPQMFPFLAYWAEFLHGQVFWDAPFANQVCRMGFHLILYKADSGKLVSCSPEGAHHDGFAYISMMHIRTEWVKEGGESVILDGSREVFRRAMRGQFEAVIIDDRKMKHLGTSISAAPRETGTRMILVTTIHQDPSEVPGTPYFDKNYAS